MQYGRRIQLAAAVLLAALLALPGCASIGPGRMVQDRTDYNASLTESWKRQILLNIVKVRYVEPVFFMEVGDIVAGYSIETGGNAGFSRTMYDSPLPITDNNNPVFGNFGRLDFGVSGRYTDRPTITYKPMTGTPFRKGVISPLPLRNVMGGLESGVSAQFMFSLGVRSINGLRNAAVGLKGSMPAQEGFKRVAEIIYHLQLVNALHLRFEPGTREKEGRTYVSFGGKNLPPETAGLVRELTELLELDPAVREYELIGSAVPENRRQIAVQTYSLYQIMAFVASRVEIPEADVAAKRALPGVADAPGDVVMGPVAVRCGKVKPLDAFAAVNFHGHWFWVDDNDLGTKRVFSFLSLAFTLMEEKSPSPPLQMTVPVN
jgi:hypothetical protein